MNLFIGKGWPAINQGRKPKGFWENEKLREKRKVSAKDERFHEKRKVSRENREVSFLVKWPAINHEKTEGFCESREVSRETKGFCEIREILRETKSFTRKPRSLTSHYVAGH